LLVIMAFFQLFYGVLFSQNLDLWIICFYEIGYRDGIVNRLQYEYIITMLLQSDWNGRTFVITVLGVAVARAFSIVILDAF
jgi:hypothetical protein